MLKGALTEALREVTTMRHRLLIVVCGALGAAAIGVLPADASGGPSANLDSSGLGATCVGGGSMEYVWSGFHNVGAAIVEVFDDSTGGTLVGHQFEFTSASSGTFGPFTFDLTDGDTYTINGFLDTKQLNRSPHGSFVEMTATASCTTQSGPTVDQKQEDTSDCQSTPNSNFVIAQSFTAGLTGNLTQVDVYLSVSNPSALTVQIEGATSTASGDIPDGSVLATATVAVPANGWNAVPLNPTTPVVAGTRYTIVLSSNGSVLAISWWGSTGDAYASGNDSFNLLNGGWTASSGCDQAFRTYVG